MELGLLSQAELPWDPAPAASQCPAPAGAELSAPPLGEFPPGEPLIEDLPSLALGWCEPLSLMLDPKCACDPREKQGHAFDVFSSGRIPPVDSC